MKIAKSWTWGLGIIALAVVMICAFRLARHAYQQSYLSRLDDVLCKNEILRELPSPDGNWKAVIFQRSCRPHLSDPSTQISILRTSEILPNDPGNVFALDGQESKGEPEIVDVSWTRPNEVEISYDK